MSAKAKDASRNKQRLRYTSVLTFHPVQVGNTIPLTPYCSKTPSKMSTNYAIARLCIYQGYEQQLLQDPVDFLLHFSQRPSLLGQNWTWQDEVDSGTYQAPPGMSWFAGEQFPQSQLLCLPLPSGCPHHQWLPTGLPGLEEKSQGRTH